MPLFWSGLDEPPASRRLAFSEVGSPNEARQGHRHPMLTVILSAALATLLSPSRVLLRHPFVGPVGDWRPPAPLSLSPVLRRSKYAELGQQACHGVVFVPAPANC